MCLAMRKEEQERISRLRSTFNPQQQPCIPLLNHYIKLFFRRKNYFTANTTKPNHQYSLHTVQRIKTVIGVAIPFLFTLNNAFTIASMFVPS